MLAAHPQPHAAGHEHDEARARFEKLDDSRRRRRDLFEVIEDQQKPPIPEKFRDAVDERLPLASRDLQRCRDRPDHQLRLPDGCEPDEPHLVVERVGQVGGRLQRQARFAHARRSGQRDEARRCQELIDLGHLALAADEAGEGDRKIVAHRRSDRSLGRKVGRTIHEEDRGPPRQRSGGSLEPCPVRSRQPQGVDEPPHGLAARLALAKLEALDASDAKSRSFGEEFLRQTGRDPKRSQHRPTLERVSAVA